MNYGEAGIEKLVGDTGGAGAIVVTDTYKPADRLESYQRVAGIAKAIELKPALHVGA